jgi:hypothetical protein
MRNPRMLVVAAGLVLLGAACTAPTAVPVNAPAPGFGAARSPRQATIVEPRAAPGVFPRTVRDSHGEVVLPMKPMRIHTLSVGYDEITFELVDASRIAAVGSVTASPEYSNVADQAARIGVKVGRDAEQILAMNPDLVVASPFANPDLLKHLRDAGVPLVVADLVSSVDAQAENVRFLAYLYGEEARGEALVREIDGRIARLRAVAARHPLEQLNGPPPYDWLNDWSRSCRAGSASVCSWRVRLLSRRGCCCWTSQPPTWISGTRSACSVSSVGWLPRPVSRRSSRFTTWSSRLASAIDSFSCIAAESRPMANLLQCCVRNASPRCTGCASWSSRIPTLPVCG